VGAGGSGGVGGTLGRAAVAILHSLGVDPSCAGKQGNEQNKTQEQLQTSMQRAEG